MRPEATGSGGWSGEVALRCDSTGGSPSPALGLHPPLQRWESSGREQKFLGFWCEVPQMLPGAALPGLLLAAPQAGGAGDGQQPAMTRHLLGWAGW